MTLISFVGNFLCTYGFSFTFFFGFVYPRPQLVIFSVIRFLLKKNFKINFLKSAFFYLIGLFFNSLIWTILPLKSPQFIFIHVGYGIFIHEIIRLLFYILYIKVDKSFEKSTSNKIYTSKYGNIPIGLACGVGYSISKALISNGSIISWTLDEGTFFPDFCPILPFFVLTCKNS